MQNHVKGYPAKREPQQADDRSPLEIKMRMILAEADFPAISKDALDALKHMPEDDASIQRLANIVLRDYALTLKVLRTANSAYYKRSDKTIQSATHAMLLLGARTVRHLAASILVFEHYRKRSPGLKELMLLSILTANHARELAMRRNLQDPEEAHLCGMFRNLGEVLIAGYFPREYAKILQHLEIKNKGEAIAAFEVLAFRFEELGEAMAKHWGMPESVITGIRADGAVASSEMGMISAFSHELTAAVYRREFDPKRDGVAEVMARYSKRLSLTREEVAGILEASLAETKEIFTSAKVTIDDLKLRRLQKAAMAQLGTWGPPVEHIQELASAEATPEQVAAIDALTELARVREELAAEVLRIALPTSGEDLNRVILMVLEAIFRGGPFDRVVFCMMTPDRSGVKARYGLGTGVEQLLETFTFELSPREGPVAVAMLRRQSVCVPVERDFTAQELRFAQSLGASSFGVFPVVVGTRLVGCVYCDRPWNSRVPDRGTLAYVRKLCEGAVKGIEARQSANTPGRITATGTQAIQRATPAYSATFKSDVVLRLLRGEAPAAVGGELGIAESTLARWTQEFLAGATAGMRAG
ncbi:MAG: HDOD domain-containing protein [Gemmatimonadota bacterium]